MNILVVCQYFWPEPFRIVDVCVGLLEKGHKVTVITGIPNYPEGKFYKGYSFFGPRHEQHQGIEIIRIPLIPRGKGNGLQLALNYLSFAVNAVLLAPFLCKGTFDIIFTYQLSPVTMALPAVFLKRIKKIPLIHYVLDLWPESMVAAGGIRKGHSYRIVGKMVSCIYRRCDLILTSSNGFIPQIISRGVDHDKVKYWPQWAEDIFLANESGSVRMSEADTAAENIFDTVMGGKIGASIPEGFKIVFAGNIGEAQGFRTIIDAAELLKNKGQNNVHWIILGDGRQKQWVESEIVKRELSENFHLLGRKPVSEMPFFYSLADALLVSLKNDELFTLTLPAKVQSYLASGKPIIAAMNGEGSRVVSEAKAGFTCPGEDPGALAELVSTMSSMPEEQLKEMGVSGRDYFDRNFRRKELLDQFDKLLECFAK